MPLFAKALFPIIDPIIPKQFDEFGKPQELTENELLESRIVYSSLFLMSLALVLFSIVRALQGNILLATMSIIALGLLWIAPILHRKFNSLQFAAYSIGIIVSIFLFIASSINGGLYSNPILWFHALIVFILLTLGPKVAFIWNGFLFLAQLIKLILEKNGINFPNFEIHHHILPLRALVFFGSMSLVIALVNAFYEAHRRAVQNLNRQSKILLVQADHLREAKLEAEKASKSRGEFIATVSHEIRTPMNGILGVAQLLDGTDLTIEQRKYLDVLRQSSEGLLLILGDVLDFSKIEAGKMDIRPEPFYLRKLGEECISVFSGIAHTKGLDLKLIYNSSLPLLCKGDPVRIKQIILNLLGNAVKFSHQGSIVLKIDPHPTQKDWIRFNVSDTGIGMSELTLNILFQPYTQADGSSTRKYGGTGLGLAICNRLIQLMNGRIEVESILEKGTEFRIDLPLAESPLEIEKIKQNEIIPEPKIRRELSGKKILLVEDNPVNRMVAVKMLEKQGVEITIAQDGKEGVDQFMEKTFDLIFMDCQMPIMDGYEATEIIRQWERQNNAQNKIPIIALTAHAMEEDRQRCLFAGMNDYLTKPVKAESLRLALETWIT